MDTVMHIMLLLTFVMLKRGNYVSSVWTKILTFDLVFLDVVFPSLHNYNLSWVLLGHTIVYIFSWLTALKTKLPLLLAFFSASSYLIKFQFCMIVKSLQDHSRLLLTSFDLNLWVMVQWKLKKSFFLQAVLTRPLCFA